MKERIKHITSLVLLFVFVLSITGINIKRHHCTSCYTSDVYIFFHPDCCHSGHSPKEADTKSLSCCTADNTSCSTHTPDNSCQTNKCCFDTHYFVKLETDFLTTTSIRIDESIKYVAPLLYAFTITDGVFHETVEIAINDPPPLPLTGKDFIKKTSQFIFYDISRA